MIHRSTKYMASVEKSRIDLPATFMQLPKMPLGDKQHQVDPNGNRNTPNKRMNRSRHSVREFGNQLRVQPNFGPVILGVRRIAIRASVARR